MRHKPITLLAFLFTIASAQAHSADTTSLVQLYQQRQFQKIITQFQNAETATLPEESLYYYVLALTLSGDQKKAATAFQELIKKDPAFYSYKLATDPDLVDIKKDPALASAATSTDVLSQSATLGHRIVKTGHGVFLYKNGLKHLISSDSSNVKSAEFLNNDVVAVFSQTDTQHKKKLVSQSSVLIYDSRQRLLTGPHVLDGAFVSGQKAGDVLVVRTSAGLMNFNTSTGAPVSEFASEGTP